MLNAVVVSCDPNCPQVWPHEVEDLLRAMSSPSAALETSLDTYTDLLCSLLDIPVYKSRIQV